MRHSNSLVQLKQTRKSQISEKYLKSWELYGLSDLKRALLAIIISYNSTGKFCYCRYKGFAHKLSNQGIYRDESTIRKAIKEMYDDKILDVNFENGIGYYKALQENFLEYSDKHYNPKKHGPKRYLKLATFPPIGYRQNRLDLVESNIYSNSKYIATSDVISLPYLPQSLPVYQNNNLDDLMNCTNPNVFKEILQKQLSSLEQTQPKQEVIKSLPQTIVSKKENVPVKQSIKHDDSLPKPKDRYDEQEWGRWLRTYGKSKVIKTDNWLLDIAEKRLIINKSKYMEHALKNNLAYEKEWIAINKRQAYEFKNKYKFTSLQIGEHSIRFNEDGDSISFKFRPEKFFLDLEHWFRKSQNFTQKKKYE